MADLETKFEMLDLFCEVMFKTLAEGDQPFRRRVLEELQGHADMARDEHGDEKQAKLIEGFKVRVEYMT